MSKDDDYPYLRAYCQLAQRNATFTNEQLRLARKRLAPEDALYMSSTGEWVTLATVPNAGTARKVRELAEGNKAMPVDGEAS